MRLKAGLILAFTLIVVIVFGGYFYLNQRRPKESARETVRIGVERGALLALPIIAEEQGFFSQEGIDVSVKYYPSGKLALKGMFAGEVGMATPAETPIVFSSFEQQDFSIIATISASDNEPRIIARKDRGIQKPGDLKGKRIATQEASAVHFFLHLFLIKNGLSEKDIVLSFMHPEELVEALVNGKIDAFSMREPYISKAKKALGEDAAIFTEPGLYLKIYNLVTLNSFIKAKPQLVNKILQILIRSEGFAKKYPEQAIKIVSKKIEVDVSEIAALWPELHLRISLDQSLLLALEDEARWVIKSRLTDKTVVPNYLNFIYQDALKAVKPEAVTIIR